MSRLVKVVIIGVAAVLITCVLAGVIAFAHYQPAVVAAPGYDMYWPTQPAGARAAITKSYQRFIETRTCEYSVLGWSAEGTLYYRETCEDGDPQTWSYAPGSESEASARDVSSAYLFQQTVPRGTILDWVRVPQVRPADAEPSVRGLAVRVDGLASPDGRRVAVVVRHIYGPEDVLVLESEADGRRLLESYTRRYGGTPAPDLHPGWLTYTHPTYGFSFRHPPDWQPVDESEVPNIIRLRHGKPNAVELTIGFRRREEEAPIQRTGVGAGDVKTQGSVQFLGRDLAREVLIYEGQIKAVMYNNACEIDVDGLVFTVSLDVRCLDYDAARIEPELQAVADEIVGSFLLSADEADP